MTEQSWGRLSSLPKDSDAHSCTGAKACATGLVLDIQHYSIQDGPGIRTTVFLKGCPLRCLWCHNPESMSFAREVAWHEEFCVHCGDCRRACPVDLDRSQCTTCGKCVEVCCSEARVMKGREMTAAEVLREVLQDVPFYAQNGGGMTLSGGEPLAQVEFALELLQGAKKAGIHTVVDTCGHVAWRVIEAALPWTDLFLFDLKAHDPELHKRLTGVNNALIRQNFEALSKRNVPMIARIPLIPTCNAIPDDMQALAQWIARVNPKILLQILPYHTFAEQKYKRLGRPCPLQGLSQMSAEDLDGFRNLFLRHGLNLK